MRLCDSQGGPKAMRVSTCWYDFPGIILEIEIVLVVDLDESVQRTNPMVC